MNQQSCLPSRQQQIYPVIMHQLKNKKSRIKRCVHDPSRASMTLFTIFIATLTYNQPQHKQSSFFIQAQQQTFNADNPRNRFCGISYKEAHQFCHLPPTQSLPCPSGIDTDCPYKLKCWTIQETCTQSPTTSPTLFPTHAPITRRSNDPTDHYFCGIGFDNLFGCGNACPGGNSAECPSGQICYFDTPCDARMQGRPPGDSDEVGDDTAIDDNMEDSNGGGESSVVVQEVEGARNFCGRTIDEAMETCSRDKHCPSGLNGECPDGMYCWSHLPDCNVNEMPTPSPTISQKPTPLPTPEPTTRSPSATESPTSSPLKASEDNFYCGRSWTDATLKCHMRCTEFYNNCPSGEECFNNVPCAGKLSAPPPAKKPPTPSPSGAPFSGTRAPTFSPRPTDKPVATASPTHSPLAKDDMRNYFFCGTSWMDASRRCYKRCVSGHHMECPGDEQCFAQADCKRGLITKKPTPHPTVAPHPGSRSPTVSPAPSVSPTGPQPTESPIPPNNEPTDKPTTPWPTFLPTFAPCQGDPCPNREHCRSKTGYCGAGPAYCNNPSWDASCGVPTDPPVSLPPTSPWPSVHPSISFEPSSPPPPTRTPSLIPSKAPVVVESQNNEPTKEPTGAVDPDEEEFGPDDPRGTFFCGTDWNHAITECPIRCPNGESTECPTDWSCYAFTPCSNVGNIQPPSLKPTWEPTRKPVIRPTRNPVDPKQETTIEPAASAQQEWQQPPSLKPTFKPTGDRCRATPCEDTNQCRSKLGFCGVGIIYCNSESSWEPECDPNFGTNGGPSHAPSTLFDAWLQKQPDITVTATDGSASNVHSNPAMDPVDEVVKEEVEDVTYADFSGDWGSDNDNLGQEKEETGESGSDSQEQEIEEEETGDWGSYSQEEEEEEIQVWWRVKSSSSASRAEIFLFLAALPFAVLLWQ